jgi:hypothetical protein
VHRWKPDCTFLQRLPGASQAGRAHSQWQAAQGLWQRLSCLEFDETSPQTKAGCDLKLVQRTCASAAGLDAMHRSMPRPSRSMPRPSMAQPHMSSLRLGCMYAAFAASHARGPGGMVRQWVVDMIHITHVRVFHTYSKLHKMTARMW